MNIIVLILTSASVFSVGGMGEDMSVFRLPFYGLQNEAQLQFVITPEFDIIARDGVFRNRYWTNPFVLNLLIPVTDRILLSTGNAERFDQSSDIYMERDPLSMHLLAQGGIEEFHLQVNANLPFAEFFGSGSYLFGTAREIWEYTVGNYLSVDTFNYEYSGTVFSAGFRYRFCAIACEGLGRVVMSRSEGDSTIALPQRLTFGLTPVLGEYKLKIVFERSIWSGQDSPNRLQLGVSRGGYQIDYRFNPWYYNGIQEHGITAGRVIPLKNIGFIGIDLQASYRSHAGLTEIKIVPELKLTLEEIFSRRKR
jgi:hypothetical protein